MLGISPIITPPPLGTFDVVISTQAEFEALLASPTWFDAVSICFVGDGGTLQFRKTDGTGILIPQTVKQIQGMNGATIDVIDFKYNATTSKAALWYKTMPTTNDYFIHGLAVINQPNEYGNPLTCFENFINIYHCKSKSNARGNHAVSSGFVNSSQVYDCVADSSARGANRGANSAQGFHKCSYLHNCISNPTGEVAMGSIFLYGFKECDHLNSCRSDVLSNTNAEAITGFDNCNTLINCSGNSDCGSSSESSSRSVRSFSNCSQLTNCISSAKAAGSTGSAAFNYCTQLTNCIGTCDDTGNSGTTISNAYGFNGCTQLVNCTGRGNGVAKGYGFNDCNYLNGCKQSTKQSSSGFLGGTNTKVDTLTVASGSTDPT